MTPSERGAPCAGTAHNSSERPGSDTQEDGEEMRAGALVEGRECGLVANSCKAAQRRQIAAAFGPSSRCGGGMVPEFGDRRF
jgi:hypothetical protein